MLYICIWYVVFTSQNGLSGSIFEQIYPNTDLSFNQHVKSVNTELHTHFVSFSTNTSLVCNASSFSIYGCYTKISFNFQINSLEFDQNTEIVAMISAEGEVVPFTKKISPNAAMVCKICVFIL